MRNPKDTATAPDPKRARLKQMAGFVIFLLVTNFALTQWVAYRLQHHPALGTRWFVGFYQPFAWVGWQRWYESAPMTFNIAYLVVLGTFAAGLVTVVIMHGLATRSARQHATIHGSAHWASEKEVRATGLLPAPGKQGAGVYVGGWKNPKTGLLHYLRHDGPEHIAVVAPSRSGKGVAIVVPTLLSWAHSVVINDRKGELWNLSAGWRKKNGHKVLRFNPSSPNYGDGTHAAFNPLDEIRAATPSEVGDVQNVTTMIVDPDGKGLNDHWSKTAFAFLTGVVLHEIYKARSDGRTASLGDVRDAITDPTRKIDLYYEEMMANQHDVANLYGKGGLHPVIASEGRTMLNKPEDERGSVLSTAISYLSIYSDPIVRQHTSRSDFCITDIMNSDAPVSLYLVSRDEDKDRMRPLLRLILNQMIRVLLRPELEFDDNGRQKPPHKHRLLLALDEFPSLGKLDIVQEALAFIAGYGIKALLIMQDMAQLWEKYTKDETVTSNCHVRSAFAPNRIETAEWISKNAGTKTETEWAITESGKRFGGVAQNFAKSSKEVSRPLLTPDEAGRLRAPVKEGDSIVEAGDMLVFVAGSPPIFGTQSLFFLDPEFLERSKIKPPQKSDVLTSTGQPTTTTLAAPVGSALSAAQSSQLWGTP